MRVWFERQKYTLGFLLHCILNRPYGDPAWPADEGEKEGGGMADFALSIRTVGVDPTPELIVRKGNDEIGTGLLDKEDCQGIVRLLRAAADDLERRYPWVAN